MLHGSFHCTCDCVRRFVLGIRLKQVLISLTFASCSTRRVLESELNVSGFRSRSLRWESLHRVMRSVFRVAVSGSEVVAMVSVSLFFFLILLVLCMSLLRSISFGGLASRAHFQGEKTSITLASALPVLQSKSSTTSATGGRRIRRVCLQCLL